MLPACLSGMRRTSCSVRRTERPRATTPSRICFWAAAGAPEPHKRGGPVLPSFTLFRIPFQRLLAWSLETGKRLYLLRRLGIPPRMSGKSSSWHLSDPGASRFWFFRSQIYRASGSRGDWLCHRSQDDPSDQKQSRNPSLLPVKKNLEAEVPLSPFRGRGRNLQGSQN